MNVGGIELNVGDRLEYCKQQGSKSTRKEGVITQITNRVIAVDLGKYRDSFSLTDIADGTIIIPGANKIGITTSEINEPYRPRDELCRNFGVYEEKAKEDETMAGKRVAPPSEELKAVWEEAKHKINPVAKHYGISWIDARRWLRDAGLLTENKTPNAPNDAERNEPKTKGIENQEPPQDEQARTVSIFKENGYVDWEVMWPVVKAELDKGRDKYDIAAELGIGKGAMRKQVQKKLNPTPVKKPAREDYSPSLEAYRLKSRDELLSMRSRLQAESELIDVILSCIDKTLREARKNAVQSDL
jgi:hypothetical protein